MQYPKEFSERVAKEYFGWPGLSEMLCSALNLHDRARVEELLNIGSRLGYNISPEKIIEHLDAGNLEQIKMAMERCIQRKKLYFECINFRFSEKPSDGKEMNI